MAESTPNPNCTKRHGYAKMVNKPLGDRFDPNGDGLGRRRSHRSMTSVYHSREAAA